MQIPTEFSTFAMAALAGIGSIPDTITDRAINITQRRRIDGERVAQFRSRRDGPLLAQLRARLSPWADDQIDDLRTAEPDREVPAQALDFSFCSNYAHGYASCSPGTDRSSTS
jgi:hypothetical protein